MNNRDVFVINHCSTNKGDRAVLVALLRELAAVGVRAVTVSASDPRAWSDSSQPLALTPQFVSAATPPWSAASPAVSTILRYAQREWLARRAFPLLARQSSLEAGSTRGLYCARSFREALARADLVLSTGGHRLTTWLVPDLITSAVYDLGLSALSGKPLVLWSQSIGPLGTESQHASSVLARVLSTAAGVYVRDEQSLDALAAAPYRTPRLYSTPESVFMLHDLVSAPAPPSKRSSRACIAIYTAKLGTRDQYTSYIQTMTHAAQTLSSVGLQVCLMRMELSAKSEEQAIRDIARSCAPVQVLGPEATVEDQLELIGDCRVMVAHKTHSVVYGLLMGTPQVAVSYHSKTRDFMSQFGIGDMCVADSQISPTVIERLLNGLLARDHDSLSAAVRDQAVALGQRARREFRSMLERTFGTTPDAYRGL